MIDFSPVQRRTIAAGLTTLAFAVVLAFIFFVGWVFAKFLGFASPALTPVIVGLFLAMLFKPYYAWFLERVRNPTLALVLMFTSVLVPACAIVWFGGSLVLEQTAHFVKSAPELVGHLSAWVKTHYPNAENLLLQFGTEPDDLMLMFLQRPAEFSRELASTLGNEYGADAMRAGFSFLGYMTKLGSWLITILFFVYFLMRPSMTGSDCVNQLPFLKKSTKAFIAKQVDAFFDILVSFFQRQVVICLIEGLLYGVGFMLVGLPYGFVLGFMLGALNLVPLLGTVTCLPLALPIAYFGGDGGPHLLRFFGVLAVWLTGQILDGYLITPKIQGEKTGLGYAGVIFSFFFWGVVFHSLIGLLLAIPLSAFCVVLWRALKEKYIRGVI